MNEIQGFPVYDFSLDSKILPKESNEKIHMKSQSLAPNVHVNPNFKLQNLAMHVNPKIYTKSLIHLNPKMMHDIASTNRNLQDVIDTTKTNIDNNANVKRSIYINPILLEKFSSSFENKPASSKESFATERNACSRLISIKNTNNRKVTPRRAGDSSVVLLSRRKLVRVARTVNSTLETSVSQCKSKVSDLKAEEKSAGTSQKISSQNDTQSTNMKYNLPKLDVNKSKMTKYKIDRTTLHVSRLKKSGCSSIKTRKVTNNTVELITIGGIVYRSSKNRLIRRSSLKRKRSISGNGNKLITNNDKKLHKNKEISNCVSETSVSSKARFTFNMSQKITHKNNISNKVKQKSIQILRNKMRKNNQPCLIFQRFGYCQNYKKGVCPKRHDKKQVSICKKFLQGKCHLDKCPLSHDVGPQKMPTCKYFLDGCCTRDACPYLHVKVSSNTTICINFLQGYCPKGNECQRRHEFLCPEFDKLGSCSKGKYCSYPHKSHSSSVEESTKYLCKKTHDVQKYQDTFIVKDNSEISNPENRLRYYERTNNFSDNFEKKENIMKKIIMKNTLSNDLTINPIKQTQVNEISKSLDKDKNENGSVTDVKNNVKRRAPIGSLPAYIPIN